MNPDLSLLHPYPFEKLRELFAPLRPPASLPHINMGMGEPRHPAPAGVLQALGERLALTANYPGTKGIPELRTAIARWLERRFQLAHVDPDTSVLPVAGTREALFAIAQAVIDRSSQPLVVCPNPFYQIYEGAALLAGAGIRFADCRGETGFLPDFESLSDDDWQRCQLLYLCTPGNPSGAVMPLETLVRLVHLAREHDFVIASDECYSEIYPERSDPPPGLLQACESIASGDYANCVVFHSLSKRSNLPGLRSGFVAGDPALMARFLLYRTYQGCALPLQHQWASIAAWEDETHVQENRRLYDAKFDAALEVLGDCLPVTRPDAGFYLWPATPTDDTDFAAKLYASQNVTVLPGSYLSRDGGRGFPGASHVRLALVAEQAECEEALQRLRRFCESL